MPNPGAFGASVPHTDQLMRNMEDMKRALRELSAARSLAASQIGSGGLLVNGGGSITIQGTGMLNVASGGLNSAGSITAGTSITAPTVNATQINASGGLSSVGAAGNDLSLVAGSRQNVWQIYTGGNTGMYGFAPSTLASKTNLSETLPFTAQDVYDTVPYLYNYVGQLAIRDDPNNADYDPTYVVPTELGLIADYLVQKHMSMFVVFEADRTTPKTIDLPLFGAIANLVAVRDLDRRLHTLEAKGTI